MSLYICNGCVYSLTSFNINFLLACIDNLRIIIIVYKNQSPKIKVDERVSHNIMIEQVLRQRFLYLVSVLSTYLESLIAALLAA